MVVKLKNMTEGKLFVYRLLKGTEEAIEFDSHEVKEFEESALVKHFRRRIADWTTLAVVDSDEPVTPKEDVKEPQVPENTPKEPQQAIELVVPELVEFNEFKVKSRGWTDTDFEVSVKSTVEGEMEFEYTDLPEGFAFSADSVKVGENTLKLKVHCKGLAEETELNGVVTVKFQDKSATLKVTGKIS